MIPITIIKRLLNTENKINNQKKKRKDMKKGYKNRKKIKSS